MFSFSNNFDLSRAHHILSELSSLDKKKDPSLYVYANDVSTEKTTFQSVKGFIFTYESNLQDLPSLLKKINDISKKELSLTDKPLESSEIEGAVRGLNSLLTKLPKERKTNAGKFVEQAIKNLREIQDHLKIAQIQRSKFLEIKETPRKNIPVSEETSAILQVIKEFSKDYTHLDKDTLNQLAFILEKKRTLDKDSTLHNAFSQFLKACITTRETNLKLLELGETPVFGSKENQTLVEKMSFLHIVLSEGGDPKIVEKFNSLLNILTQTATIINTQFDSDNFISVIYPSKELKEQFKQTTGPLLRYKELLEGNPSKAKILKESIKKESDFNTILKDVYALTLLKNQYGFYNPFFIKSEWTNVERTKEGCFIKGNRTITFANQFGEFRRLSIPLDFSQFKTLDAKKIKKVMSYIDSYDDSKTIDFFHYQGDQKLMAQLADTFQKKLQREMYRCILSLSHPKLSEKSTSIFSTLGHYAYIPVSAIGSIVYKPYSIAKNYLLGSQEKHELNINLRLENLIPRQSDNIENAVKILNEAKNNQPIDEKNAKFVDSTMASCDVLIDYLLEEKKEIYNKEIKTKLTNIFKKSPATQTLFLKYFQKILDLKPHVMKELASTKENEFPIGYLDDITLQKIKMELVNGFSEDPALINFVMHLDTCIVRHYQQVFWGYSHRCSDVISQ